MDNYEYILDAQGVIKDFPGMRALNSVQLKVKKGTVHGIVGENGAGKSTLCKILIGLYRADGGMITFKNQPVAFKSTQEALGAGISMIHQELANCPERTVAENFYLGRELHGAAALISSKQMAKRCQEELDDLNIKIDASKRMGDLSVAQQQLCEIARAVSYNADLIIMDEPTSALTEDEVQHLFQIINDLKSRGITILYISHRMEEIFSLTDQISVYRDGEFVGCVDTDKTSTTELISMMVGRNVDKLFPRDHVEPGEVVLKVENLSRNGEFENVSFEVRKGEIFGVAGLMGAGRSEIMETIFGVRTKSSGNIYLHGEKVEIKRPRDAIRNNIAFLTEDRKKSGLFLPLSVTFNTVIASLDKYCSFALVNQKKERKATEAMREQIQVKTSSINKQISELSGGNQQKVLLGRWLLSEPDILIVDEPTRGIDVAAKALIHSHLNELSKQGVTIIMVSSELPEILGMSDRIMVVHEGKVTGIIDRKDATQELIMSRATGIVE